MITAEQTRLLEMELCEVKLPNVIEWLRAYWKSDRYIRLDPVTDTNEYVAMTLKARKAGLTKSDADLDHLYRWMIVGKGLRTPHTDEGDKYFARWREWFDEKMWPLLREKARTSFGLYAFYMDVGKWSDGTIYFDYAAWTGDVATACLLAHGLVRDMDGNIVAIAEGDPISTYVEGSGCFKFIQYRSEKAQEAIKRMKAANPGKKIRVGVFGGGADPTIWLNNFNLNEVELVVYDTNPKMKAILEQILGQSAESLGIIYETRNFMEIFEDEALQGTFDIIVYNGVMAYYPDLDVQLSIIRGTWGLLRAGGMICFEDIIQSPDMAFAFYVRRWENTGLTAQESLEIALEKNKKMLSEVGFTEYEYEHLEVQEAPIDLMNYAIKAA